jgi:hypothetical protein
MIGGASGSASISYSDTATSALTDVASFLGATSTTTRAPTSGRAPASGGASAEISISKVVGSTDSTSTNRTTSLQF